MLDSKAQYFFFPKMSISFILISTVIYLLHIAWFLVNRSQLSNIFSLLSDLFFLCGLLNYSLPWWYMHEDAQRYWKKALCFLLERYGDKTLKAELSSTRPGQRTQNRGVLERWPVHRNSHLSKVPSASKKYNPGIFSPMDMWNNCCFNHCWWVNRHLPGWEPELTVLKSKRLSFNWDTTNCSHQCLQCIYIVPVSRCLNYLNKCCFISMSRWISTKPSHTNSVLLSPQAGISACVCLPSLSCKAVFQVVGLKDIAVLWSFNRKPRHPTKPGSTTAHPLHTKQW